MRIHDNGTDRDMTPDEIAEHQALVAQWEQEKALFAEKAAARRAIMVSAYTTLGLSADEINIILGS